MPYCAYLRKSRADLEAEARGEGETLARHYRIVTELAQKRNISLPDSAIFREIVSGESIAARPVVQELLRQVEAGAWDGVLVVEVERLARGDTMDQGQIAKSFKLHGTKIITPTKTYDPNNEFDEEYFEFGLFMSRREYKTIRRRMERGRIAAVKEGKYIASVAPYGYRKYKLENNNGYSLEIIPEEAEVIRMIYELYTRGDGGKRLGIPSICHKLDQMHIQPRNGSVWSRDSVRDILTNPVYIGKVRWGYKKETKNYANGTMKKTRHKNSGDFILCDGLHDAIIDDVSFALAAKTMKLNRLSTVSENKPLQNPLTGIVYCKLCGRMMTRCASNTKTNYPVLRCPNYKCKNVSAPLSRIEGEILKNLREWCSAYELESPEPKLPPELKALDEAIASEENKKETFEKQLSKTYDLLEQGLYSQDLFRQRHGTLLGKLSETERNILELRGEYKRLSDTIHTRLAFVPAVRRVLEAYPHCDSAEQKNDMLRKVVQRAEYKKETPNRKGMRDVVSFEIDLFPAL